MQTITYAVEAGTIIGVLAGLCGTLLVGCGSLVVYVFTRQTKRIDDCERQNQLDHKELHGRLSDHIRDYHSKK